MKECRKRMSGRGRIAEKERRERGREVERGRENHTQIVSTLLKPKGEIHCAHRTYSHRITLERTSLSY